jgi:Sec-independent protein translocase protein TatA
MNDYISIGILVIVLIAYLLFFKEKLIKWEERNSIEKSNSIRLTIIMIIGIILLIYQKFKN